MADRYVNYDKLLEERPRLGLDEMSKIHKVNAFNHFIDNLPTADVKEVVKAKWEEHDNEYETYYTCSACKCDWTTIDGTPTENNMNYCPHCGADMRGDTDESM